MKGLKKYYRQVGSWLPCSGKMKRDIMERIRASITAWLDDHPAADIAALVAHFGTPRQIAAAYVDNTATDELLKALRVRRRIVGIVTACAAVIILLWACVVTAAYIDAHNSAAGYSVVYTNEYKSHNYKP